MALGVAGKDGAPVSAPSPSAGPSQLLPRCSETPGPCLCRSALRPRPASSAPARPQWLWSEPQSSRGCPPAAGRTDGRTGGPGWAVSGRWASLRPSRAAGPLSVLGRANGAGGRLRAPHTTVLTEGSERLSGPVISVGWYCCKIEIQTRRPLARPSGARAGPGRVDQPAGRPAGRRARPGGGWGALLPLTPSCSGTLRGPGRCPVRLSVCLRGRGAEEGGQGVSALPMTGTHLQLALLPLNSASRQHCVFLVLQSAASTPGAL